MKEISFQGWLLAISFLEALARLFYLPAYLLRRLARWLQRWHTRAYVLYHGGREEVDPTLPSLPVAQIMKQLGFEDAATVPCWTVGVAGKNPPGPPQKGG
jgi:hypothetical protein